MQGQIDIPAGLQTRLCVLGEKTLEAIPSTFRELWPGRRAVIVADENTWKAAGARIADILRSAGIPQDEPVIYPSEPELHADESYSASLKDIVAGKSVIAVGGGTINDICKLASTYAQNDGYLCVATAASVDGFTSFGGAMTVNGFKKTLPCAAPRAIIADTAVVGSAPPALAASGYADLAAKIPAGADWHIADCLGEHPIDPAVWRMIQPELRDWLDDPEGIRDNRPEPLRKLFKGLAMTGFAMQFCHDSRPASGAEHLLSHVWEMDGVSASHGFKVAVGTLFTTALMTETFSLPASEIASRCAGRPGVSRAQRSAMVDACLAGTPFHADTRAIALEKLRTGSALSERRAAILSKWETMRSRVLGQLLPFDALRRRFAVVGAPTVLSDIGMTREGLVRAAMIAALIRKRYTVLDMLNELGLLEELIEQVLTCGRYF